MKTILSILFRGCTGLLLTVTLAVAADGPAQPVPPNIVQALQTDYVDRETLQTKSWSTLSALIDDLAGGVRLFSAEEAQARTATEETVHELQPLARAEVIDPAIGYIRLADVMTGSVSALDDELRKFEAAKTVGYVLDLRFADGTNYQVAAAITGRFLGRQSLLFTLKSRGKTAESFHSGQSPAGLPGGLNEAPLMVLVNNQTRGAAEVLAAALQAQRRAIVIGNQTAGSAVAWQPVALPDGRVFELATAKMIFPGGQPMFPNGIAPDIRVQIDPAVERDAVLEAAADITLTASLQPAELKKGMREADLVKAFNGEPLETPALELTTNAVENGGAKLGNLDGATNLVEAAQVVEHPKPDDETANAVRDVVLQRAVDILKGIRVLVMRR